MTSIGQKLGDLRKRHHLSQEDAADKLGVTRQTISKWETDQSTPDFDKISSICSLYEITPNELFGTEMKHEEGELLKEGDNSSKKALGIAGGVLLYFLAVSWIVVSVAALKIDPIISTGVFLAICGVATVLIIYVCLVYKVSDSEKRKKENPLQKSITDCLGALALIIYFIISFATMAWHITWIIWLIYGLLEEVVKLVFILKEGKDEK